jgi:hypothetical protein
MSEPIFGLFLRKRDQARVLASVPAFSSLRSFCFPSKSARRFVACPRPRRSPNLGFESF